MSSRNYYGSAGHKTVLYIEDSPTQAIYVQALLEEKGMQVICAVDGKMGIRMAEQIQPDLIILDVQMPVLNGFEVCEKLKQSPDTANIPIIMFTRNDDPEAVKLGLKSGVVDYIPKDAFAGAVLLETIRQMGLVGE